jgi:hypothetical protein
MYIYFPVSYKIFAKKVKVSTKKRRMAGLTRRDGMQSTTTSSIPSELLKSLDS